jgi:cytochrome b561
MTESQGVPLDRAQRTLAMIWFPLSALIIILFIVMTFGGALRDAKHPNMTQEAFAWVLPALLPTLSLIVGALGASAVGPQPATPPNVNRMYYRLAIALSVFYLLLVLATPLAGPLTDMTPSDLLKTSNLWLAPIQGLTASTLGALFVSKKPAAEGT